MNEDFKSKEKTVEKEPYQKPIAVYHKVTLDQNILQTTASATMDQGLEEGGNVFGNPTTP